jgi:hypothetical protein
MALEAMLMLGEVSASGILQAAGLAASYLGSGALVIGGFYGLYALGTKAYDRYVVQKKVEESQVEMAARISQELAKQTRREALNKGKEGKK